MIDLTKPIRRKRDKGEVSVRRVEEYYIYDGSSCFAEYAGSPAELEDAYENIPEPRKPKEWMAYENRSDVGLHQYCPDCIGKCIRVIEWPVGAALPDWPEGYE